MAEHASPREHANVRRSQAILRMPVHMIDAVLIRDDGDRSDVLLFVPPSEDLGRYVDSGAAFLPVIREANTCLVARTAIAAIGVASTLAPRPDDLPTEQQRVRVDLRGGIRLEGLLTWVAPAGQQRTADHLNAEPLHFTLIDGDTTYFVRKASVLAVVEL